MIGVCDPGLQQDLLTKEHTLPTLAAVVAHNVGFEAAQRDQERFHIAESASNVVHGTHSHGSSTSPLHHSCTDKASLPLQQVHPREQETTFSFVQWTWFHLPWPRHRKSACLWCKTCDLCGKANHFATACHSAHATTLLGLVVHVA